MLRLFDTRTGQAEPLRPAVPGILRIYTHERAANGRADLGLLRGFVLADLIRRGAEQRSLRVLACQGVADAGISPQQAAAGHDANGLRADTTALNIRPADDTPRASQSAALILDLITRLIEAGHAYPDDVGNVYFGARPAPGQQPGDGAPGSGWLLWTGASSAITAPPGTGPASTRPASMLQAWQAPWGDGFPGWQAQAAAMSVSCLGQVIDVVLGLDSQEEQQLRAVINSAAGHEVVRHWVRSGQIRPSGSPSEGAPENVAPDGIGLADLTGRGLDPLAARLAFLSAGYRDQLDLSWDALTAADAALRRWRRQVAGWADSPSRPVSPEVTARLNAALDDDLDTAAMLDVLRYLADDPAADPGAKFETFARADQVLALDLAADIGRY